MSYVSDDNLSPLAALESQVKLGRQLRQAREEQKIDLQSVCDSLKIRRFFLECIENGRFDQLPGTVYTVGFIKSYAQYLGLDVTQELEYITSLSCQTPEKVQDRSYLLRQNTRSVSAGVIMTSIALLVVFIAVFAYIKTTYFALPTSSFVETLPTPHKKEQDGDGIVKKMSPSEAKNVLKLSASRQTWIKITDEGGKLVVARLLRPGESYELETKQGYHLTTADGGALFLSINGGVFSIPKLEEDGLLEDMPIDPASLQDMAKFATHSIFEKE
jgi:cytoskeletal protein RodZ